MAEWEGMCETDVDRAREEVFSCIRRYRDRKVFYFNGWHGFGAAPVLRSMKQELRSIKAKRSPPELCFDAIIYIDCSAWESRRVMQRKIAEELKLGPEIMAMFDKQDEEDDFNGLDHGSRDVIPSVTQVIARTQWDREFCMLFLNGSDDEVDLNSFGFTVDYCNHIILWTFKKRPLTIHARSGEIQNKLRYTHIFLDNWLMELPNLLFMSMLRGEATDIATSHSWMRRIDLTMVIECCLYELFLQYSFHSATEFNWVSHAPNCWTCDGIIKGDGTRKISDTLHQEIHWVCDDALLLGRVFGKIMEDPEAPFLVIKDDVFFIEKRQYRWICVTSKNLPIQEDTKAVLERASSVFVALEKSDNPQGLPNGLLTHCSSLGVLVLYYCAFNFTSPPFLQCCGLRFLGLDHCTHDNTSEGENQTNWACLQNLWVLDLRYTEWRDILSEEKMDIMANLRELNIEGVMCWQLTSKLQGRLRLLQKLRIFKPTHKAEATSMDHHNSFVDKMNMEILDLSGNRDMENLPASLSMAKNLQMLLLDGCDGLENVVVLEGLPSSLRSFSFDGYGPLTHWMPSFKVPPESSEQKLPIDADERDVKTSKISLKGCTQLENLFVRGLPNLVELDLSGCAIKVLDFTTMVLNVPVLKRLFLLGCENLRAIICGSNGSVEPLNLELVCIDTRSERARGFTRPSLAQHKHFLLQLHAILADVRLARSLYPLLMCGYDYRKDYDIIYKIHVTSPVEYGGGVQLERAVKKMIEPGKQQHDDAVSRYGDVFSKLGDTLMLVFPQPPTQQFDRHIEISGGSHSLESELSDTNSLHYLMTEFTESLHVHDASTIASMPKFYSRRMRWCRMERCSTIKTVSPRGQAPALETVWASDLQMARNIWNKNYYYTNSFESLKHLHVRSCPRLQFVLPVVATSFPNLVSLHIIQCDNLTHVFVLNEKYPEEMVIHDVSFPKLTTIHLHDLPKLRQISEVKTHAPALETIRIRGCWSLRRLPSLQGCEAGVKRPTVEMEKDVWDALEWDGLAAGHHPDLFEPPVHSRYYRRKRLLKGTVLR